MSDLTEFLLARIGEDEAAADDSLPDDGTVGTWSRWVKAECEAKRRIMEECADLASSEDVYTHADLILRALALPYAEHPSFDPSWRL